MSKNTDIEENRPNLFWAPGQMAWLARVQSTGALPHADSSFIPTRSPLAPPIRAAPTDVPGETSDAEPVAAARTFSAAIHGSLQLPRTRPSAFRHPLRTPLVNTDVVARDRSEPASAWRQGTSGNSEPNDATRREGDATVDESPSAEQGGRRYLDLFFPGRGARDSNTDYAAFVSQYAVFLLRTEDVRVPELSVRVLEDDVHVPPLPVQQRIRVFDVDPRGVSLARSRLIQTLMSSTSLLAAVLSAVTLAIHVYVFVSREQWCDADYVRPGAFAWISISALDVLTYLCLTLVAATALLSFVSLFRLAAPALLMRIIGLFHRANPTFSITATLVVVFGFLAGEVRSPVMAAVTLVAVPTHDIISMTTRCTLTMRLVSFAALCATGIAVDRSLLNSSAMCREVSSVDIGGESLGPRVFDSCYIVLTNLFYVSLVQIFLTRMIEPHRPLCATPYVPFSTTVHFNHTDAMVMAATGVDPSLDPEDGGEARAALRAFSAATSGSDTTAPPARRSNSAAAVPADEDGGPGARGTVAGSRDRAGQRGGPRAMRSSVNVYWGKSEFRIVHRGSPLDAELAERANRDGLSMWTMSAERHRSLDIVVGLTSMAFCVNYGVEFLSSMKNLMNAATAQCFDDRAISSAFLFGLADRIIIGIGLLCLLAQFSLATPGSLKVFFRYLVFFIRSWPTFVVTHIAEIVIASLSDQVSLVYAVTPYEVIMSLMDLGLLTMPMRPWWITASVRAGFLILMAGRVALFFLISIVSTNTCSSRDASPWIAIAGSIIFAAWILELLHILSIKWQRTSAPSVVFEVQRHAAYDCALFDVDGSGPSTFLDDEATGELEEVVVADGGAGRDAGFRGGSVGRDRGDDGGGGGGGGPGTRAGRANASGDSIKNPGIVETVQDVEDSDNNESDDGGAGGAGGRPLASMRNGGFRTTVDDDDDEFSHAVVTYLETGGPSRTGSTTVLPPQIDILKSRSPEFPTPSPVRSVDSRGHSGVGLSKPSPTISLRSSINDLDSSDDDVGRLSIAAIEPLSVERPRSSSAMSETPHLELYARRPRLGSPESHPGTVNLLHAESANGSTDGGRSAASLGAPLRARRRNHEPTSDPSLPQVTPSHPSADLDGNHRPRARRNSVQVSGGSHMSPSIVSRRNYDVPSTVSVQPAISPHRISRNPSEPSGIAGRIESRSVGKPPKAKFGKRLSSEDWAYY